MSMSVIGHYCGGVGGGAGGAGGVGNTSCRRDQDLHRRGFMVFVFVCMRILFTTYF